MGLMMQMYPALEQVTDFSSRHWSSLRTLADLIVEHSPTKCTVEYSDRLATLRVRLDPDTHNEFYTRWSPAISFEQGIRELIAEYVAAEAQLKDTHHTYIDDTKTHNEL
jgi:dTDP-D-glucose 4,6-dehydratase